MMELLGSLIVGIILFTIIYGLFKFAFSLRDLFARVRILEQRNKTTETLNDIRDKAKESGYKEKK